ncbi:uncharacterized protein [Panulirus ornatus]|uniref:uncharacterized protein n=1 Tax=Panulirus ornatus TaxID=150431 RepID=UPI003A85B16E
MLANIATVTTSEVSSGQAAPLRHQGSLDTNNNSDRGHCDNHVECGDHKHSSDGEEEEEEVGGDGRRRGGRGNMSAASGAKYQLRPRSVQARRGSETEWSVQSPMRRKPRPPPLSRYRRKTANARERYRMRQINSAFESLRGVLPAWVCSRRAASHMTKITTLRLASAYISSLQDILDGKAHQDTRSWVLSSLLPDVPSNKHRLQSHVNHTHGKTQATVPASADAGHELASLLGGAIDTQIPEDNMGSFFYLTTMPEGEGTTLLLGCEPPRSWKAHHPPLLT